MSCARQGGVHLCGCGGYVGRFDEVWLVGDGDMYIYIYTYLHIYKWGEPKRLGATWDNANKVHAT